MGTDWAQPHDPTLATCTTADLAGFREQAERHTPAMPHVLVACEIGAKGAARRAELRQVFQEQLEGCSWVKAIRDVYVVRIGSSDERDRLHSRLRGVAESESGIRFIMTPAMVDGRYSGWLSKDRWSKIRETEAQQEAGIGSEGRSTEQTPTTKTLLATVLSYALPVALAIKVARRNGR